MNNKIFEWAGVITAILYSLFVAMNIGIEFFGFCYQVNMERVEYDVIFSY